MLTHRIVGHRLLSLTIEQICHLCKNTRMITTKKVAFHTLGCKLNFSETSTIARDFVSNGFKKVDFSESADIYVINTCYTYYI